MTLRELAVELKTDESSLLSVARRLGFPVAEQASLTLKQVARLRMNVPKANGPIDPSVASVPRAPSNLVESANETRVFKVRINELARDLQVKAHDILELLPSFGVTEKKTHSSSIDVSVAKKLQQHFGAKVVAYADDEPLYFIVQEFGEPPNAGVTLLSPICNASGKPMEELHPSRFVAEWHLTDIQSRTPWQPGAVVFGKLLASVHPVTIDPGTVELPGPDLVEVIAIDDTIEKPDALFLRSYVLDHPPCPNLIVLARNLAWAGLQPTRAVERDGRFEFRLAPPPDAVQTLDADRFRDHVQRYALKLDRQVRLQRQVEAHGGLDAALSRICHYTLLVADDGYLTIPGESVEVSLPSNENLEVSQATNNGGRPNSITAILDRLSVQRNEMPHDVAALIGDLRHKFMDTRGLTDYLLENGELEDELNSRTEQRFKIMLAERSAEMTAAISAAIAGKEAEIRTLEEQRIQKLHDVEVEIQETRQSLLAGLEAKQARLLAEVTELEDRSHKAVTLAEQSAERWSRARLEVIQEFLTLSPLLPKTVELTGPPTKSEAIQEPPTVITLPEILLTGASWEEVPEQTFFRRFTEYLERSGFSYSEVDRIGFHMAFKSGDFMVLVLLCYKQSKLM